MEKRPLLRGLQLEERNPQPTPSFKPSDLSLENIHVVDDGAPLQAESGRAVRAEDSLAMHTICYLNATIGEMRAIFKLHIKTSGTRVSC